jgi:hypothetical protein
LQTRYEYCTCWDHAGGTGWRLSKKGIQAVRVDLVMAEGVQGLPDLTENIINSDINLWFFFV